VEDNDINGYIFFFVVVVVIDLFQIRFSAVILSIVLLIGILAATSVYICSKTYRRTSKDAFIHKYKYNRSKRRAEAILQSIPDPIIVLNGDGRVVECNQQAIDVFGAESKKRLLGCHIKHIFGANQESLLHDNLIQPGLHEIKVKRHNSSDYFMAEANFAYAEDINDDDNEKPFMTQVVLLRDISAKIESALQLQKAKQEAEESNQKKSQFLSFVCHELRSKYNE
jgi:PAS domain S-box-containing protein